MSLSYGKENGFMLDCGRFNFEDNVPIEVLFVDGGERNIDSSKYGSKQLLLPKSQSLVYEGRIYVTDAEGLSIFRGTRLFQLIRRIRSIAHISIRQELGQCQQ